MSAVARRPSLAPRRVLAVLAAAVLLTGAAGTLAACSSGGSTGSSGITVSDAWVRVPGNSMGPTAAYMTIANSGSADDALLSATSSVAGSVEIHQTTTDASGMTGMSPVDRIAVPAGKSTSLAPGGFHMMLMDLTRTLAAGDKVQLELTFDKAGKVTVEAEVRAG